MIPRRVLTIACLAAGAAGAAGAAACGPKKAQQLPIQTASVERRDIVVDAEATGTVEPINIVEVKSKASGQITKMPVDIGSLVKPGDLLVQIDARDVRNQYDQAAADVRAAQAKLSVSTTQQKRADDLFAQQIITAQEHETATLDYANSQAQLVRARAALDLARQRLEDATVTAPVAGTVIEKPVSLGTVISSATGTVGGGTTILKMADLNQVRVRALVNETDIGQVQPGQQATVTVDAYPDRPFQGRVEKVEPQAVVQQSVTMFPVLVSLSNREGLLKPGMNGDVSVLIEQRLGVLAVPNDAVRNVREAASIATTLGLDPATVQQQLQAQMAAGAGGAGRGRRSAATPVVGDTPATTSVPAGGRPSTARGEVALATQAGPQQSQGGGQGGAAARVTVTDADCQASNAALAKRPAVRTSIQALQPRVASGELDPQQARAESERSYAAAGLDATVARACMRRARMAAGGDSAAGGATAGAAGGSVSTRARSALVFVGDSGKYAPRVVRLGVANYDYTEVLSGVAEGDQVALLAAAALQQQRQARNARIAGATAGAVPGVAGPPPGAGGGRRGP